MNLVKKLIMRWTGVTRQPRDERIAQRAADIVESRAEWRKYDDPVPEEGREGTNRNP